MNIKQPIMQYSESNAVRNFHESRRSFLLAGTSLAILPLLQRCTFGAIVDNQTFGSNPFAIGVASGDPSTDGFVIWTRLAVNPIEGGGMDRVNYAVRWEVAIDDSFNQIVQSGSAIATPQLGHSVHVEVEGLESGRWYFYRFQCGNAESTVGRSRTSPALTDDVDRMRFAFASCQNYEQGFFTAYKHMAEEDLDLVIHLGDYIYESKGHEKKVRMHNGEEIQSLDDYRNRHALYKSDPNLQLAHAHFPWAIVWDDHEVDNNYASDISEESFVTKQDFLIRRANAYQAFYEHMPIRKSSLPAGPHMQIYRTIDFGSLANFQMLDTRQYRTDQPNGDHDKPITSEVLDPRATLLGDAQENWLQKQLISSQAQWNVLAQQVMMARVDIKAGDDALFAMDQWAGYDVARKRLLSFMSDRRIPNPVVLTGDIHSNWVNDLKIDFDNENDPTIATEFVCTSISSGGNGKDVPKGSIEMQSENPFVRFHNAQRGYVSCELTKETWKSNYQVVERVEVEESPLVTRASFVVESGKAGVV